MDATDIFARMGVTLARPDAWTRRAAARRHDGAPCDPCSPQAVCWCIYGARDRELFKIADPVERDRLDQETDHWLHEAAQGVSPSALNDDRSTTHEALLGLVRRCYDLSSASRNA